MLPTIEEFKGIAGGWGTDTLKFYGPYEGRYFHKGIAISVDCLGEAGEFVAAMRDGYGYTLGKWCHQDSLGYGSIVSWSVGRFRPDHMDQDDQEVPLINYEVLVEGTYYQWMNVRAFSEESAQALARERFRMADAVCNPEQTFIVEKEEY
mgnify:FL=1